MLPVGAILQDYGENGFTKFTEDEQITMMTLWSIFRSPLFIGAELTKCDEFTLKLLTNDNILKMHKNARCSHQVWRRDTAGNEIILWKAICSEGGIYIAVFNTGDSKADADIALFDLELDGEYKALELWSGEETNVKDKLHTSLRSHGARAFLLT